MQGQMWHQVKKKIYDDLENPVGLSLDSDVRGSEKRGSFKKGQHNIRYQHDQRQMLLMGVARCRHISRNYITFAQRSYILLMWTEECLLPLPFLLLNCLVSK